jgi:L-threonylcarbamoyladenylate synthase
MPSDEITLSVLRESGPLAVSSANRSGLPPATTCANAQAQLGDAVSVYLDGGPTVDAVASTIVDLTGDHPVIVRDGAISIDRLREFVPDIESR